MIKLYINNYLNTLTILWRDERYVLDYNIILLSIVKILILMFNSAKVYIIFESTNIFSTFFLKNLYKALYLLVFYAVFGNSYP